MYNEIKKKKLVIDFKCIKTNKNACIRLYNILRRENIKTIRNVHNKY